MNIFFIFYVDKCWRVVYSIDKIRNRHRAIKEKENENTKEVSKQNGRIKKH